MTTSSMPLVQHPIHHVVEFHPVGEFRLRVRFEDGLEREIDFLPVLHGPIYGPLRDLRLFREVRLDYEIRTLAWPDGADFDPWTLHDWPIVADSLVARFDREEGSLSSDPAAARSEAPRPGPDRRFDVPA